MKNKFQFLLLCLLSTASVIQAAIPRGYYDSASGLAGTALRQELHNIIDGHTDKSYDYLWTAFATTDIRTSLGSDYIWCMYTELEFHHDEDQSSGTEVYTTYNREHSWPKSWANETYPHYTDLYHLYPTQAYANSIRNNLPYGEIENGTATYTSENGSQRGDARTGLGYSGTVFEPIDEYKGDLARSYFYISTRYYTEDSGWDTSPMTNKCELLQWAVNMLLNWHHDDPVSQKELDRVEAVYAIQGNRNPFIDHPEYADSIWASSDTSSGEPTPEPSVLSAGDIAFTGVNMDGTDQVSIVFLVDINDGTEIKFTDNGWLSSNDWRTGEGTYTWTASQNYLAGDEIVIDFTSGPALSATGDQVIAFQNTADMVAALNDEGSHVWQAEATSSNTSALPQGLVNGSTCVALDEIDNTQYDRSLVSGTKEEILAAINDYTNWSGDDANPLTLSSTGFTVSDIPLPITLASFNAKIEGGAVKLFWETASETNNARFLIYRNNKVIGMVDGAGTSSEPRIYTYVDDEVIPGVVYTYVLADIDYANIETKYEKKAVTVIIENNIIEAEFEVGEVYPNPFNPNANLPLTLRSPMTVNIDVYDLQGNKVSDIMNKELSAGDHRVILDLKDLPSALYLLQVNIGDDQQVRKVVLSK